MASTAHSTYPSSGFTAAACGIARYTNHVSDPMPSGYSTKNRLYLPSSVFVAFGLKTHRSQTTPAGTCPVSASTKYE